MQDCAEWIVSHCFQDLLGHFHGNQNSDSVIRFSGDPRALHQHKFSRVNILRVDIALGVRAFHRCLAFS